MNKIAIIADTSQDFTFETAKKYGLELIPYYIEIDGTTYRDLIEINSREFYRKIKNCDTLSTGVPPLQDVLDLFERLKSEGYTDVIAITTSAALTGMYAVYGAAVSHETGLNIRIFDTRSVASGAALFAIRASELRAEGKSADEIVTLLEAEKPKVRIYAVFRTLTYLVKGGRFNKYRGMIGNLLHIHPLLCMDNGALGVAERIRGQKKSLKALAEKIREEIGNHRAYKLVFFSGDNQEEVAELRELLRAEIAAAAEFLETELTAVLGVHAGPGAIGACVMLP